MIITLIAAHSEDGIIAQNGRIPWHLPDDIALFRQYCEGKWLLVGRRTWDQMHGWFQPGQTPVVVTRNAALAVDGGYAVTSVEAGLATAQEHGAPECVVIGGGEIFAASLPYASKLVLTEVHATLREGTRFPEFKSDQWRDTAIIRHEADAAHAFAFTIRTWQRAGGKR